MNVKTPLVASKTALRRLAHRASQFASKTQATSSSHSWYAVLNTNEYLGTVPSNVPRADGYLVGVGFGSILKLPTLFRLSDPLPYAIIGVDRLPQVVLAARIMIRLLARSNSLRELCAVDMARALLPPVVDEVISAEQNTEVAARLGAAQVRTHALEALAVARLNIFSHLLSVRAPAAMFARSPANVEMGLAVERWFSALACAARKEAFVMLLGDIADARLTRAITRLPGFATRRNVIYVSNVSDHLSLSGRADLGAAMRQYGEQNLIVSTTRAASGPLGYPLGVTWKSVPC